MLDGHAISIADRFWSGHFGCPVARSPGKFRLMGHGGELADYHGVFALFRNGGVTISYPREWEERMADLLAEDACLVSEDGFIAALEPVTDRVIGPACIGYAAEMIQPGEGAVPLGAEDASALGRLQAACDPVEWEHGGSQPGQTMSGVFVGGELAAVAGYEVWSASIAHIAVISHPDFRGKGHGRAVVAHVARRAIAEGLLAQYRTLEANIPSMHVAESLGFRKYGSSVAVRLR